ncbi:hypothetical protein ACOSQ4_022634 [Xanthoceras sorbifolium]
MREYLEWAPVLYEDFLTVSLSQRIEEDMGMNLRHTLLRHTLMSASLAYKNMLKTESNKAKRRELRDELVKAMGELAAGAECEKRLAAEVKESHAVKRALELEVKVSTIKINELQVNLERARGELDRSRELTKKLNDELARKGKELAQKEKG